MMHGPWILVEVCVRASDRTITWQEAQLSQRDRATLRVIEYFAKSLKVIRNDTDE